MGRIQTLLRWGACGLLFTLVVLTPSPEGQGAAALRRVLAATEKQPSAVPAPAKPPQLLFVFPAGGRRGSTAEVVVHGVDVKTATAVRLSGPGVTARILPPVPPVEEIDPKTGKKVPPKPPRRQKNPLEVDTEPVRVAVTLAADAPLGERDLRVLTPGGLSNRLRFVVGQLAEAVEAEPNSTPGEAQPLPALPATINGQLHAGDIDVFRFTAKAGQTLVCELLGRRLAPFLPEAVPGWLQGVLTLYDATGREVCYVDDFRNDPDPVLIHRIEKDGEYRLEVRDALYRGTQRFVYRLNIGALPFVTDLYPPGGRRGTRVPVRLTGVNLERDTLTVEVPAEGMTTRVGGSGGGLASNTLPFAIGDDKEAEEVEANDTPDKAMPLSVGTVVNGRIGRSGDVDCFRVTTTARQTLVIDVRARRLASPLDAHLAVLDATGGQLAANDDTPDEWEQEMTHHADARVVFTAPAAGSYLVRLSDVQGNGGPECSYRLTVAELRPDFLLRMLPDQPTAGGGDCAVVRVEAVRRDYFNGPITLAVQGLPAGYVASRGVLRPGQTECALGITIPATAQPLLVPLTVTGTAEVNGRPVTRRAVPAEEVQQAFAILHRLPAQEGHLSVSGPAPLFTLTPTLGPAGLIEVPSPAAADKTAKVMIKIHRQKGPERLEGDDGSIRFTTAALAVTNRPAPRTVGIPFLITGNARREDAEATVTLTVQPQAVPGEVYEIVICGTMRLGKDEIVRSVVVPVKVFAPPPPPPPVKPAPVGKPKT